MTEPNDFSNKPKIAPVGIRIGAFLIDFFSFWLFGMLLGLLFGTPSEDNLSYGLDGWPAFILIFVGFLIWPFSEGLWGKTIGKTLLDLKVVDDNYRPIGMGQATGRFLLGFIDYIFCIGIFIALINKKNKRIGDLAAGTIVVRVKKANT